MIWIFGAGWGGWAQYPPKYIYCYHTLLKIGLERLFILDAIYHLD
jgi:hypothetical protein